jgi:hypothetical protein
MTLEFSGRIFEKYSHFKFHGYPSSGSQVVPYGRTDGQTDRQTDMPKLTVALPSFAVVPSTCVLLPLGTRFDVLTLEFLKIQVI